MDDSFSKLFLAYILLAVGFVVCVIAFFVCGRNAFVDGAAQRQYKQDCTSALTIHSNPGASGACYSGDANVNITRQENVIVHHHAYLSKSGAANYTYSANLTLPNGTTSECTLPGDYGQSHLSYSGTCETEIWNKMVTQVTIKGDVAQTADNPDYKVHSDLIHLVLYLLGAVVFGALATFFNKRDSALKYN